MGCCNGGDTIEDNLSKEIIQYIRDNLEANLVKQTTLNAELNNIYKKLEEDKNNTPDNYIKEYSSKLIELTNTNTEKESQDIRSLLEETMKLANNNVSSFHIIIFEKLQGLRDYSNIKDLTEKNISLKNAIKENSALLMEVFNDLKSQGITDISQLTFEKFKEECSKHGVKMSEEELKQYYDLLKEKPKEGTDISSDIKEYMESHEELKNLIDKSKVNFKKFINKINKEGIDISKITFEEFKKLCKDCNIKFKESELKEIFELISKDYLGFINYINGLFENDNNNNENNLIKQAKVINNLSTIDYQLLPVAQKLDRNF